jgi:short subunit fatty acids transporter
MEIIPKPKRKFPSPETIFLYFTVLIFIVSILFSLYFWFQENSKKRELSQIKEKISSLQTPEIKKMEEELQKYQDKISHFSNLIKDYLFYSKIFPYLEQKIHKKVYLSQMELDFENSKILISGSSPNFYILSQQIEILKSDPSLRPKFQAANLGKEGEVEFKIEIEFNKNILK